MANTRTSYRCAAVSAIVAIAVLCAHSAAASPPPPNPHLSAPIYGVTHVNPAQTNGIPYKIPRGEFRVDLSKLTPIWGGPVNNVTYAAAQPGFFWSVSTDRVAYIDARNGRWTRISDIDLPGAQRRSLADLHAIVAPQYTSIPQAEKILRTILGPEPGKLLPAGIYAIVSNKNVVYANAGTTVSAIGLVDAKDPRKGLEVKGRFDTAKIIPPTSLFGNPPIIELVGMNMTYDGHIVIGALNGIAIIDQDFKGEGHFYAFEDEEMATNSFAVDEGGGIYVATGSKTPRHPGTLRKLVWDGNKISDDPVSGAWAAQYDGGDWPPAIKAGTGTGSTPTLMGFGTDKDRLVLITDGANRMKLVAFWRDRIPPDAKAVTDARSPRIAGEIPVTAGLPLDKPWIQSEQTIVVSGYGAFVVNNLIEEGHPDRIIDVLTVGPVHAPPRGVERIEWDAATHAFRSVWTRADVSSSSMVSLVSSGANAVYVNGYSNKDGWEVTGLDWTTGKTVFRTIFGQDNKGNGAYAILQFIENGDLLFNSVIGPYRIQPSARRTPSSP